MTAKIYFYFDFISPYSYFAWRKLPALAKKYNREIEARPIVFGKLLDKWGQLGPAEIPPKNSWLNEYCLRYAAINEFEFNPPKTHPFNPLAALRMSLKEVSGADQLKVIDVIFKGGWSQGADLGDLSTLISLLAKQSINGEILSQKISETEITALRGTTDVHATRAIKKRIRNRNARSTSTLLPGSIHFTSKRVR